MLKELVQAQTCGLNRNIEILNQDGQLVVSSRSIAENFKKNHRDVLESIDQLVKGVAEKSADLFIPSEYTHEQNKQIYREYLLTKDGFSLLVMGFTGAKALEWKLKYIEAFNKMENKLKNPVSKLSKELQAIFVLDERTVQLENEVHDLKHNSPLFNIECDELQYALKNKAIRLLGGKNTVAYKEKSLRSRVFADIQKEVKRQFGLRSYKAIKRGNLEKAFLIIEQYKLPYILEDEITLLNNQISM